MAAPEKLENVVMEMTRVSYFLSMTSKRFLEKYNETASTDRRIPEYNSKTRPIAWELTGEIRMGVGIMRAFHTWENSTSRIGGIPVLDRDTILQALRKLGVPEGEVGDTHISRHQNIINTLGTQIDVCNRALELYHVKSHEELNAEMDSGGVPEPWVPSTVRSLFHPATIKSDPATTVDSGSVDPVALDPEPLITQVPNEPDPDDLWGFYTMVHDAENLDVKITDVCSLHSHCRCVPETVVQYSGFLRRLVTSPLVFAKLFPPTVVDIPEKPATLSIIERISKLSTYKEGELENFKSHLEEFHDARIRVAGLMAACGHELTVEELIHLSPVFMHF